MRMRLWWSVGSGSGPVAVASLAPLAAIRPEAEAVHVEVFNVPVGFDPPAWVEVDVHGDIAEGDAPLIRAGEVELWPGTAARGLRGKRPWWVRHADA
jgi:hypothetical protein